MVFKIKDTEYPLHFGLMAMELFTKRTGNNLQQGEVLNTTQVVELIYAAISNGCYRTGDAGVKFSDVYDEVENLSTSEEGLKAITDAVGKFWESSYLKGTQSESKKKKSTGKK